MKITFTLPENSASWAGQALAHFFPDGLAETRPFQFNGWLRKAGRLKDMRASLKDLGASRVRGSSAPPPDWAQKVRSKFPAQKIGPFLLLPSWRKAPRLPKGRHLIRLLQGQAFGTGLHPSTRLMLQAVAKSGPQGKNVLDIGAGSGVLSFAALALGARKAACIEIEDAACAEMRENREANKVPATRMPVRCGAFPKAAKGLGAFDLVLGNILTPVLCANMGAMKRHLKPGGTLLMSGIHGAGEAKKVKAAAKAEGLKMKVETSKGEWKCLEAQRP